MSSALVSFRSEAGGTTDNKGVPVSEMDLATLARDKELGIPHYNNIKDKKAKGEPESTARKV